jgi:hypothetical protein
MQRATYFLYGVLFSLILYTVFYSIRKTERKAPVKGIDREYYLEVSQDSIWVESRQGQIYSGKYTDLDSLITIDNL